jgi:RNA polymerase sigma-70 factor (ECF subfamily)
MARGDPLAHPEELLRRVYAYVAYRVGDSAEAEDITSETFERALRYRNTYDARKGEPVGWLLGIARNCIYDAHMRPKPTSLHEEPAAPDDPEEQVATRLALSQALASLTDGDRDLLALRYGAGLSPREIAALLDRRTNAVEVALSRAKTRLGAALEQAEEGTEATPLGLQHRAV